MNRESQSESRRDGATFSRTEKMTYATAKSRADESLRNLASGEVRERSTSGFPQDGRSITVGRLVVFRILTLLIVVAGASSLQTMQH